MSNSKREVIELVRRLPGHVTTSDILEEIYFKQQIDAGLDDVAKGRVISNTQLRKRIARWRRSEGTGSSILCKGL